MRNSSIPTGQGGDFNVYTQYYVEAPRDVFPTVKDEAWQVVMSFEPSPQFGAFVMQQIAKMRSGQHRAGEQQALALGGDLIEGLGERRAKSAASCGALAALPGWVKSAVICASFPR